VFKPIVIRLTGLLAVVWFGSTAITLAQEARFADPTAATSDPAAGGDQRHAAADELLRQARLAMADNNLSAADQLISRAEALDVRYGLLYSGDTPAKLRRELQQRQSDARLPARPSQKMSPRAITRGDNQIVDPFVARSGDPAEALLPDSKSTAKSYILKARKELEQNNLPAAIFLYRKAAEQRASFGPNED
jgi:hypothetical protein